MDMGNGHVAEYVDNCFSLARSIRIKFDEAAKLMNEGVVARFPGYVIDQNDPSSWKWYMNVCGMYHPTDRPMTVISIDTLQEIVFSKENLAIHTATAKSYQKGSRFYEALRMRYPDQQLLIDGILYPADMQTAIDSPTGEIIAYRKDLVQEQEATLIQDLSFMLRRIASRWLNAQFAMSNSLFCTVFYTQLYTFLVSEIMALRVRACRTNQAHTFHITTYLSSKSGLAPYLPFLTLKQSLWLYRNVLAIERNAGKSDEFDTLLEKILTDRNIPLASYSVRHHEAQREDYRPDTRARRVLLNMGSNFTGVDYVPLSFVFDKERDLVSGNPEYLDANEALEVQNFELANSSVTQTRVYESSMVDYSNALPETLEEVCIRQWCYLSTHDFYNVYVTYKEPRSGEFRTLLAKDAFIYMYYIQMSANGYEVDRIPEYLNMQQRRHPKPSLDDLVSIVPQERPWLIKTAQMLLNNQPSIVPVYSVSAFFEHAKQIHDQAMAQWFLISGTDDMDDHGYVANMIKRLYSDERVSFDVGGLSLQDWLASNNLPAYDYSREEAMSLTKSIYAAATGHDENLVLSLSNIQKAMIGLFKSLTAYPLQFIREINEEDIVVLNRSAIRHGRPHYYREDRRNLFDRQVEITAYPGARLDANLSLIKHRGDTIGVDPDASAQTVSIDTVAQIRTALVPEDRLIVPLEHVFFNTSYDGQDEALDNEYGAIGYTLYHRLSEAQKERVKSRYAR